MLKTIDPLLSPDLLYALAAMGHGDRLVLVDANFPATSVAAETVTGGVIRCDAGVAAALQAILTLFPLDTFEPDPAVGMLSVADPRETPAVVAEMEAVIAAEGFTWAAIDRYDFYDRAKEAFAIVQTAERRFYGNVILTKGVIPPA
ncbi:RbsD/FucU family protein [Acuticoccus sp. I52.16.1]|uniref:RbsD/FucU family protein n=1 Tax=Acuticoccus sp. I52.16.1 TaxID=2928472 RepID=UPI001FD502E8|nr:RbsD/FucU domain-containing protein [Acuticoccus sp. I52.16.1]UOM35340.1 ribose ABC transporter [Acuticoccus sp. I52.16.1]